MTAHTYILAAWEGEPRPRIVPAVLLHEARATASTFALVVAFSRSHARRLWLEGTRAIRGADGKLECCGIVEGRAHD